jgi:hypothetical protein
MIVFWLHLQRKATTCVAHAKFSMNKPSALGLGRVKTRRRSIAIVEVIRPRAFQSLNRARGFNLEIELKNIILRRVSIFEFLHSQGQSRHFGRRPTTSGLPL